MPGISRSEPVFVKLFGERNTGTNFVSQLIERNLDVRMLDGGAPWVLYRLQPWEWPRDLWFASTGRFNLGWKHSYPDHDRIRRFCAIHRLVIVTVSKHPYPWLLSMLRRPYHYPDAPGSMNEFLETTYPVMRREHADHPPLEPVSLWNRKYAAYRDLDRLPVTWLHVRYEDALVDPEGVIRRIAGKVGVRPPDVLRVVERSTKRNTPDRFDDYRRYYLEGQWRDKLTSEQIAWINDRLDADLVRYFGYELDDPGCYREPVVNQ